MGYDYNEAVYDDIKEYLEEDERYKEYDCARDMLRDDDLRYELLNSGVTGNADSSYTHWRQTAKDYVTKNIDLAVEMSRAFGCDLLEDMSTNNWEAIDVRIRCHLVDGEFQKVVEDNEEEWWPDEEEEEDND